MKPGHRGLIVLALLLCALPLATDNAYVHDVAIRIGLNAIAAIGLNLLIGYTGQISLGHAGFLGIGAYASAMLPTHLGWPPLAAMACGALASGLLAFVVARPVLRLKGHYLAMATLGLGWLLSIVINNESAWTGGPDGMSVPSLGLFRFELSTDRQWYAVVAVLLVAAVWFALRLVDSPAGRALQAVHGSEAAAQTVGIYTASVKSRVFVLSAMVASVVGSLSAHQVAFVTPGVAGLGHSIELVTMVVVGGMASVFGSVVGAALLTLLPQALSTLEGWETVAFGAILMGTMIFLPRGIVPSLAARWRRQPAAARRPAPDVQPAGEGS